MATELHEEVVLITNPQLVTTNATEGISMGAVPSRGPFSGSVELGRRLLLAARHGQTSQVLDLMAKGAPFTTDWLGTSPLHVAAYGAHVDTCAVLLRAGVSRDSRTKVERTPLHLAAHAGHAAVAALLLERGALVDCRDMLRMTPLHWASERGHTAVVKVLLRHGADPRAVSKFNKTPLLLAAARGHLALLRLLEDAARDRDAAPDPALVQDEQITEIPAAEQQQALESIERLQESVKPASKVTRTSHVKLEVETEPEMEEQVQDTPSESIEEGGTSGISDGGAAALLRKHGITLLPPDSSSTVLNAIQSGRTVVLSDAGKLMLKESSSPLSATSSKNVILTAAPVKAPPAGVKIFTLNNKLRPADKVASNLAATQDVQIKLVSLPESKLSSPAKISNVSMKAKSRRSAPAGLRHPVKIIMQKANFDKMVGKGNNQENGAENEPVQITSTTDLSKVLQVSNAIPTIAPSTDISTVGGVNTTILANTGGVGAAGAGAGTGFLCVPAEFLSSSSPAYLRSQLLSAHKTINDLNQQVSLLKEQLAAYQSL